MWLQQTCSSYLVFGSSLYIVFQIKQISIWKYINFYAHINPAGYRRRIGIYSTVINSQVKFPSADCICALNVRVRCPLCPNMLAIFFSKLCYNYTRIFSFCHWCLPFTYWNWPHIHLGHGDNWPVYRIVKQRLDHQWCRVLHNFIRARFHLPRNMIIVNTYHIASGPSMEEYNKSTKLIPIQLTVCSWYGEF